MASPSRLLLPCSLLAVLSVGCVPLGEDSGLAPAGARLRWNATEDSGWADEDTGAGESDGAGIDFEHDHPQALARVPDARNPGLRRP
jgi:hypothetical protein